MAQGGEAQAGEQGFALEGFLHKSEFKAPTQCGCFAMRPRHEKGKFAALALGERAMLYAKTRARLREAPMRISLADFKAVHLLEDGLRFQVVLRKPAQAKYKGREHYTWRAQSAEIAAQWVELLREHAFLRCNVYSVSSDGSFPEKRIGVLPRTAVCFSGGGARSHSATVGQLRALRDLGLLDNRSISYISAVSGSSWATSVFTFYETGAADDDDLLGAPVRVSALDMDVLDEEPCPLLQVATVEMWKLAETLFWSAKSHEWWETTVGQTYLEPFGLDDDRPFAHNNMRDILHERGAVTLTGEEPHFSRPGRPFWIANGAVLGPRSAQAGDVIPVQFTPMYSGTPYRHTLHAHGKHNKRHSQDISVGGGMIDSYAFGSEEPTGTLGGVRLSLRRLSLQPGPPVAAVANAAADFVRGVFHAVERIIKDAKSHPSDGGDADATLLQVPYPARPLTLRHTVGISSHAPALQFKNNRWLSKLNPRSLYWNATDAVAELAKAASPELAKAAEALVAAKPEDQPELPAEPEPPADEGDAVAQEMDYADGGTLDNLGLLAMLQRRVKRIVVCINSEVEVPYWPKRSGVETRPIMRGAAQHSKQQGTAGPAGGLEEEGFIFEGDPLDTAQTESAAAFLPAYEDWPQSSILPLFGIDVPFKGEFGSFENNHVFRKERIVDLLEKLQRCKLDGDACVVRESYEVQKNAFWRIAGGWTVDILWVYMDKAYKFELQLPSDTLGELEQGLKGAFPRYPLYKTFGTRRGKWIDPSLTRQQAALLAAQAEWALREAAPQVRDVLRTGAVPRVASARRPAA